MMLKKLSRLLSPSERQRAVVLLGIMLVTAFLDTLGVASILPFIAVLTNPQLVQTNDVLSTAFAMANYIGIHSTDKFLFAVGVVVFILLMISLACRTFITYAQTHFALMCEYSVGKRLVEGYLRQPYTWFLNRHSADLDKTILSEVSIVINGSMLPLMVLVARIMVVLALLFLLFIVDPILAFSVGLVLGLAYAGILTAMRGRLKRLGEARVDANKERFVVLSEAFGAVKEVKVGQLEQVFTQRFSKPAKIYAKTQAMAQIITEIPRFALEGIAFGGMLLMILYLMTKSTSFSDMLPVIALYAFAGYRLMPAVQQIYGALGQLRFGRQALDALYKDLMSLQVHEVQNGQNDPLPLTQTIELKQVSYIYPDALQPSLTGINITIPANSTVGFVGTTGSGKTTLVDVILGLLEPQQGKLLIDGKPITAENCRQWQRAIGYVPQQIYLADDTLAANIAFGISSENISQKALECAAKIANLHDFVINDLPEGYATTVGERGVRLSGGQSQRIGIARALYHSPQLLILDEATSALDNITEKAVMEAVSNLGDSLTTILIAHRLSTVRKCDHIYLLDRGEVIASGTYDELKESNQQFAAMTDQERT